MSLQTTYKGFITSILALLLSVSLFASDASLIQHANTDLPHHGILMQSRDGFVYLKVSDAYINELFAHIDDTDYKKPPYFRRPDSPGAHISVLYVQEAKKVGRVPDLGKEFTFQINDVARVFSGKKGYFILKVTSPELEAYRENLGLNPKLQGHDFHITIATKQIKKYHQTVEN